MREEELGSSQSRVSDKRYLAIPAKGAQITKVVEASFLLISGVYYPISVLPEWMQIIAVFSPVTYVLDRPRAAILDGAAIAGLVQYIIPI